MASNKINLKYACSTEQSIAYFLKIDTQGLRDDVIEGNGYEFKLNGLFKYFKDTPVFEGSLSGSIDLICQHSLESFSYSIEKKMHIAFTDDAVEDPFENYACANNLDLIMLVQEEILLALPLVAIAENL